MVNWISIEQASAWDYKHSTKERRLVTIHSGSPLEVIPIGRFWVPFLRNFDSLAFINMGPKQVDVSLTGNASTSDGVPIEGTVHVQVIVSDDESSIKRMAVIPLKRSAF